MTQPTLVLATGNRKKGIELAELFGPIGLAVRTLADFDSVADIVEDGDTFGANAALKAVGQAKHLKTWALGEDSGLAVDALDGAPGIYSARFSGEDADDDSNNQKLLDALGQLPLEKRTAHYVCHMTLSDPEGNIRAESEAFCRGRIGFDRRGTHGFGYDPLFEIVEYHRTFGQLGPNSKATLSHRARAARRILPQLMELVDSGEWT